MTTPVEIWGPAFVEFAPQRGDDIDLKASPKFSIKWLSNPTNVFSTFASGNWCRLCQTRGILDREQHLKEHMVELEVFLQTRKLEREAAKETKEVPPPEPKPQPVVSTKDCYANPCVVCGQLILKTGKRGHPPQKCPACR